MKPIRINPEEIWDGPPVYVFCYCHVPCQVCLPPHILLVVWILLNWIRFQGPWIWRPHPCRDVLIFLFQRRLGKWVPVVTQCWCQNGSATTSHIWFVTYREFGPRSLLHNVRLGQAIQRIHINIIIIVVVLCFLFNYCQGPNVGWFQQFLYISSIYLICSYHIGFVFLYICQLCFRSEGHYIICQVAWTLYPFWWLTAVANCHRFLQGNLRIKATKVPMKQFLHSITQPEKELGNYKTRGLMPRIWIVYTGPIRSIHVVITRAFRQPHIDLSIHPRARLLRPKWH